MAAAVVILALAIRSRQASFLGDISRLGMSLGSAPGWKLPSYASESLDEETLLFPSSTWFSCPVKGAKTSIDGTLIRFWPEFVGRNRYTPWAGLIIRTAVFTICVLTTESMSKLQAEEGWDSLECILTVLISSSVLASLVVSGR